MLVKKDLYTGFISKQKLDSSYIKMQCKKQALRMKDFLENKYAVAWKIKPFLP